MSHRTPVVVLAAFFFAAAAGGGCTSSNGQTYRSATWKAGRPLGDVLVIVPSFSAGGGQDSAGAKDPKIREAVRVALQQVPGTRVMDEPEGSPKAIAPVSEAEAVAAGRKAGATTVCMVTPGQFGGRYVVMVWPPGWDSRTTVQYSLRLIDVATGELLVDSIRERTTGGYFAIMTATYPDDLQKDVTAVLSRQ